MLHTQNGEPGRKLIEEHSVPVTETGCWLWDCEDEECVDARGHRTRPDGATYAAFRGPVPDGWAVVHDCGVSCCVNPAHMHLEVAPPAVS